jgi:hypothetical protein
MRINKREEERKQADARLENRGLDQVLNTLRNSCIRENLQKFKPFKTIHFTDKGASIRSIIEDRKSWMARHGKNRWFS